MKVKISPPPKKFHILLNFFFFFIFLKFSHSAPKNKIPQKFWGTAKNCSNYAIPASRDLRQECEVLRKNRATAGKTPPKVLWWWLRWAQLGAIWVKKTSNCFPLGFENWWGLQFCEEPIELSLRKISTRKN